MYETPRRIWRNISEIPNFGWIVCEVVEYSFKTTKEDDVYIPDRDGFAMMVWTVHYWTREEAYDFYLLAPRTERFELLQLSHVKPNHD